MLQGRTVGLQDSENLVSRDEANLGNSVRIPQCDTNLRWRKTFPRELGDLFNDLVGSGFGARREGCGGRGVQSPRYPFQVRACDPF